jgi:hypothetical protein
VDTVDAPARLHRGDTWDFEVYCELPSGVAENIAGQTLYVTLKKSRDDADPGVLALEYVVPNDADAQAGKATVVADSEQTLINPGNYWVGIRKSKPGTPPDVRTIYEEQHPVLRAIRADLP